MEGKYHKWQMRDYLAWQGFLLPSPPQNLRESFPKRGEDWVTVVCSCFILEFNKMSYLHTHWRDVDVSNSSSVDILKNNSSNESTSYKMLADPQRERF